MIYFDSAATTCMAPEVIEEMTFVMKNCYGNPSSLHAMGRKSKALIENSRQIIAELINTYPRQIIFTGGGTEGNNLVLRSGVLNDGVQRIITSPLEHSAVLNTVKELGERGIAVDFVKLKEKGDLDLAHLEKLLQNPIKTRISIMHANNEIGNINDIYTIGEIAKKYNCCFHSDTVQTIGKLPVDMKTFPADYAVSSAHKFHGPKGVGFLWVKEGFNISSIITGGGQERNARAGTENLYGIVGMVKALELAYKNINETIDKLKSLKKHCLDLLNRNISDVKFNGRSGELDNSMPNILSIALPIENNLISFILDMKNIAISQGSACSSGSEKGSHVVNQVGEPNTTTIRMSFSKNNTVDEIEYFVKELKSALDQ